MTVKYLSCIQTYCTTTWVILGFAKMPNSPAVINWDQSPQGLKTQRKGRRSTTKERDLKKKRTDLKALWGIRANSVLSDWSSLYDIITCHRSLWAEFTACPWHLWRIKSYSCETQKLSNPFPSVTPRTATLLLQTPKEWMDRRGLNRRRGYRKREEKREGKAAILSFLQLAFTVS